MSTVRRAVAMACAALLAGGSLAAQQRTLVAGVFGGGYTHLNNISQPEFLNADFRPGFNVGLTGGVELNEYVALHVDGTYANSRGRGAWSGAGKNIHHWFAGAHVELGYPLVANLRGFVFGGGGVMTIDPASGAGFSAFTKPAGQTGLGMLYSIPGTNMGVMLEGKSFVYLWDRAGFHRTVWDASYSMGLMVRAPW